MSRQDDLAMRIRAALPTGRVVREVRMFGGLAFMLDDAMVVSAGRRGDLLVRIDPTRHDDFLGRPGARPALMGQDRPMGPGWIEVAAEGVAADADLRLWLDIAIKHRDSLPPRARGTEG